MVRLISFPGTNVTVVGVLEGLSCSVISILGPLAVDPIVYNVCVAVPVGSAHWPSPL